MKRARPESWEEEEEEEDAEQRLPWELIEVEVASHAEFGTQLRLSECCQRLRHRRYITELPPFAAMRMTDDGARMFPGLRTLDVGRRLTSVGIAHLTALTAAVLWDTSSDIISDTLALPKLRHLEIQRNVQLPADPHLSKLERLALVHVWNGLRVETAVHLTALKHLVLEQMIARPGTIEKLTNLRSLVVSSGGVIGWPSWSKSGQDAAIAQRLTALPALTHLTFTEGVPSVTFIRDVLPQLRSLETFVAGQITFRMTGPAPPQWRAVNVDAEAGQAMHRDHCNVKQ